MKRFHFLHVKVIFAKSGFRLVRWSNNRKDLLTQKNTKEKIFDRFYVAWTSLAKQNMIRLAFLMMDSGLFEVKMAYIITPKGKVILYYISSLSYQFYIFKN